MPCKSETPRTGGATRNSFGGWFRGFFTPLQAPAQFLVAVHNVGPDMAVIIAALAFGLLANG